MSGQGRGEVFGLERYRVFKVSNCGLLKSSKKRTTHENIRR